MLGRSIADPDGIEGPPGESAGLGWLGIETVLTGEKVLRPFAGVLRDGSPVDGFEMHTGRTTGPALASPLLYAVDGTPEGAMAACGRVIGTYVHGLLLGDAARAGLLRDWGTTSAGQGHDDRVEGALDALAAHLERHVNLDALWDAARRLSRSP